MFLISIITIDSGACFLVGREGYNNESHATPPIGSRDLFAFARLLLLVVEILLYCHSGVAFYCSSPLLIVNTNPLPSLL